MVSEIKLNYLNDNPVPVPYYVGGKIYVELLRFLTRRYYHPKQIDESKKKPRAKTITDLAINIRYLHHAITFDIELEDEEGELIPAGTLKIEELNSFYMKQILTEMHDEWEIKGQSLVVYLNAWSEFYKFLTAEGISHEMLFEGKIEQNHSKNQDDDPLSHTHGRSTTYTVETDPLIERSWLEYSDDYRGSVISMNQYYELYEALYNDDPVYAVMAGTLMQTFLRIGAAVQMPLIPNKENPLWMRFVEFSDSDDYQSLKYTKKGGDKAKCYVHKETMRLIHEEYLLPFRGEREELFINNYATSKHALKKGITEDDKFLWLNEHGTPVTPKDLQRAFKRASKKLGFKVTPHFMRHTGATQLLYYWAKAKGTEICEHHKLAIHAFLKDQLGHSKMETTLYYIRTIESMKSIAEWASFLPNAIPATKKFKAMRKTVKDAFEESMYRHDKMFKGAA